MAPAEYLQSVWERVPAGLDPSDFTRRREFVLRGLRAQRRQGAEPLRVLDVGCGEGHFAGELARAGMSVLGVDVAEEPLRRARARHLGLDFRLVPVEGSWSLADASFDAVWAGETIEHVADTVAWFSQLRRLLRSGGTLLLSTPAHGRLAVLGLALSGRRFDAHFDPRSDHLRFYTARTLRALLEDLGFQDIDVRGAAGVPGARRLLLASARRSRF
jgi:2-polyprenyl-3-methyl-5-hydroxy-6-metoxy-1,4-benzoquinol methylase